MTKRTKGVYEAKPLRIPKGILGRISEKNLMEFLKESLEEPVNKSGTIHGECFEEFLKDYLSKSKENFMKDFLREFPKESTGKELVDDFLKQCSDKYLEKHLE